MKILVYGFKPYGGYVENITERLLDSLHPSGTLVKKVFDVRFDARMFNHTLARVCPDLILGLGQHPRARKLRIERKAKNLRVNPDRSLKPVLPGGPPALYASLALPRTKNTTVTYDAGTYVCNYSMYLAARYCARSRAKFAFVHVPKDYDLAELSGWLTFTLDRIQHENKK